MKKLLRIILSITVFTIGCNSKNVINELQISIESNLEIELCESNEEELDVFSTQGGTLENLDKSLDIDYQWRELLRVDFTAKTSPHVCDITEYYTGGVYSVPLTHISKIPAELCSIILDAMQKGTEQETLTPLIADTQISQEEFCRKTGIELASIESIRPVRLDADNDGIEDLVRLYYWGGTSGFSSMEFYKSSIDGTFIQASSFDCLNQVFNFIQYQGKHYLLMKEFDYNTKNYNGYSLYLYANGELTDGKHFSFCIDDYAIDVVYEDTLFEEIGTVKKTLCNKEIPDILKQNGGVINGTAESLYSRDVSLYKYSCDLDNDGDQEYYNKYMWYPSNMGTVMRCEYQFKDSMILEDLCNRLSDEIGNSRLYTFWVNEVKENNLLYLYFGNNLDFSLYAFLITKSN